MHFSMKHTLLSYLWKSQLEPDLKRYVAKMIRILVKYFNHLAVFEKFRQTD
jgi:hypothetical protein